MEKEKYLKLAIQTAEQGIKSNNGPFGAIIVLDNKIISRACNLVTSTNDPTAHAEIVAIRQACKTINNFNLSGAVLYSSCEPCPMCLSAIYWARIKEVYYCSSREDAEKAGFSDNYIYQELAKPVEQRALKQGRIKLHNCTKLFEQWGNKKDKKEY